ncbi:MAG: hypothetical protein M3161_04655, partial [Actinomycetota bacterium]|nr:hypothetical protein [Actinomycetota bacterium]
MAGLSPTVENAILRGLGAYLRDTPKNELPPALRAFHGKHQKMLAARRRELLGVFDRDDALRALIIQWLDDDAPLTKRDAELLRVAAERSDDWEQRLGTLDAPTTPRPRPREETARSDALERERDKTRKARDEARRAKEEAARRVEVAEKEKGELATRVRELTQRVDDLEKQLARAQKEATKARSDAERAERKARRAADEGSLQTRGLRKEISELRAALERASASAPRTKAPRRAPVRAGVSQPR